MSRRADESLTQTKVLTRRIQSRPPPSREMGEEDQMSAEEHRFLLQEHRTWQLIRAVFE